MAVDSLRAHPPAQLPASARRDRSLERLRQLAQARWAIPVGLVLITAVSALLRTQELHFYYWIDEGISVGIASHPLSQLHALLREDGSPPLYYAMLHVWMQVFGRGEVATHVLSLCFGLLAIPVGYWGAASLFDRRVGIFCALVIAAAPFVTSYSQETRMYSLLLLLSLIVAASFVHVYVYRHRRHLPLFVVSLAASLYTHNWALFLGVAAFAAYLACLRLAPVPERRGLLRDGAIGFGLVALLYLPWLPTLLYQAAHTGAPWALKPNVWSLTQGLYFIVGGRGAAVALLFGAGAGLLAVHGSVGSRGLARTMLVSLLVLGFGTLLIAWVEAKVTPAWAPRYEAVIVGPLALLAALGLSRAGRLGLAALALCLCFWILDPLPPSRYAKSNVAAAATAVGARTGANALVLSTQPEQVPTIAHYLPLAEHYGTPIGPVSDPRVVNWRSALERFHHTSVRRVLVPMLSTLTPGERVALVVPTRLPSEPLWMVLINRSSRQWTRYLYHDPQLQLVKVSSSHSGASGLPVKISLYVMR